MPTALTAEQAATLIGQALQSEVQHENGLFRAEVRYHGPFGETESDTIGIREEDLERCIERLGGKSVSDQTVLYDNVSYEALIREEAPLPGSWWRRSRSFPFSIRDPDLGIRYTLGGPSDEYLLFILEALRTAGIAGDFYWRPYRHRSRIPDQLDMLEEEEEERAPSLLDVLRYSSPRLITLHISTEKERSLSQLQSYADAFLFQLSFNLDVSFVRVRSLEDLVRRSRIRRVRRARIDELDPPRRAYGANLIYHYQMAVSTDNAPLEFLSYYHVAEAFFESVFHDELVNSIRDMLTRPGFSYRRTTDVRNLINHISNKLRFRQDEVIFSEQEALRLTLARFVNLAELRAGLDQIDSSLVQRYGQEKVSFSQGDVVDLNSEDEEEVYTRLAGRIYKTRNAVVHSKEGTKPKYIPFRHDPELLQEVPLVRLIAEQIIVGSAKDLS